MCHSRYFSPDLTGKNHKLRLVFVDPQHECLLVKRCRTKVCNVLHGLSQQLRQRQAHFLFHGRQPFVDLTILHWYRCEEMHLQWNNTLHLPHYKCKTTLFKTKQTQTAAISTVLMTFTFVQRWTKCKSLVKIYQGMTWILQKQHHRCTQKHACNSRIYYALFSMLFFLSSSAHRMQLDEEWNSNSTLHQEGTLVHRIAQRKLTWSRHVSKMGSERLPVKVMHCSITGRRNQGKQPKNWIENTKQDRHEKHTIWRSDDHGARQSNGDV